MLKKQDKSLKENYPFKIVHMTSVHQPGDVRIFIKECCSLAAAGYSVYLIVPDDQDRSIQGVQLLSVPRVQTRMKRFIRTIFDVYKRAMEVDGQIYHFHDPELILIGLMLKIKGKAVVYDVHEDVPLQIMTKSWIPALLRKPLSIVAQMAERIGSIYFDRIVAATPSISRKFPDEKCIMVQNYPIIGELLEDNPPTYQSREKKILYAGGITKIRGITELIEAIDEVKSDVDIKLLLAGKFNDRTLQDKEIEYIKNNHAVEYFGWLDRQSLKKQFGESRVGLITFHPAPNHINAQPNKLFEYMSSGLPVIASDFPLWRKIVEESECGILVDPLDPRKIAEAICWIFDHPEEAEQMGRRGKKAVQEKYSWESQAPHLLAMYEEMRP